MNLSLFKSFHALVAAGLLGGFCFWLARADITPGRGAQSVYLLWTGWVAFILFIVLALYAVRKYAHKRRLTPEFKMRVPVERLEKAQARLSEIRTRVISGELRNHKAIRREARQVLKAEGASGVLRVRVEKGPPGGPRSVLRVLYREPLVPVAKWMHAHIYYGLAAAGLVFLHGGGNMASPMGILLNGLSYLVIATGFVGILLWTFGPSWLTRRERDLSVEKAYALRDHYARKAVEAEAELRTAAGEGEDSTRKCIEELRHLGDAGSDFTPRARSLLEGLPPALEGHRTQVRDVVVLLGQRRNVEGEWRSLAKIRLLLHVWRLVHVPASILLMFAVVIHILSVWWY